ncbi:hypothetical protein [Nonomuraea candida]|nr:hypothetical protein [Nonomuraea candida]
MRERMWLAILGVTAVEAVLFLIEPALGWTFVLAVLVGALQELLKSE